MSQGKLSEATVRERVKPLFYTRMRLGEFDPPQGNPYSGLGEEQVETTEHQALAVTAAAKSYVLLKNQRHVLPLKEGQFKNVAVRKMFNYFMILQMFNMIITFRHLR